jgi:hypothetical protein
MRARKAGDGRGSPWHSGGAAPTSALHWPSYQRDCEGFVMPKRKYSPKAQKTIASKMSAMKGEKLPRKQKVAIAISTARQAGLKVPKRKGK